MDYTQVEGYAQAKAEYDGAVVAARAANDELAEYKAKDTWRDRVDDFKTKAAATDARNNAVEAARAKAKVEFPHAPEVIYSSMSDPEAILAAAQQAHTAIAAAIPPPQQTGQNWGTPPAGTAPATPGTHKWHDKGQWDGDIEKLRNMPKNATGAFDSAPAKAMRDFVAAELWGTPLKNAQ